MSRTMTALWAGLPPPREARVTLSESLGPMTRWSALATPDAFWDPVKEAKETIKVFKKADPGISKFLPFVFPRRRARRGGPPQGGGLSEGNPMGKTSQVTVGSNSASPTEIVFFGAAASPKKGTRPPPGQRSSAARVRRQRK